MSCLLFSHNVISHLNKSFRNIDVCRMMLERARIPQLVAHRGADIRFDYRLSGEWLSMVDFGTLPRMCSVQGRSRINAVSAVYKMC